MPALMRFGLATPQRRSLPARSPPSSSTCFGQVSSEPISFHAGSGERMKGRPAGDQLPDALTFAIRMPPGCASVDRLAVAPGQLQFGRTNPAPIDDVSISGGVASGSSRSPLGSSTRVVMCGGHPQWLRTHERRGRSPPRTALKVGDIVSFEGRGVGVPVRCECRQS